MSGNGKFENENYIAVADDLDAEDWTSLVVHDRDALDKYPAHIRDKIVRLMGSPDGKAVLNAARAEYREWVTLKLELMADQAADTLKAVMNSDWPEHKTAMAATKAAEMVLDRTGWPKVTRRQTIQSSESARELLPPLAEYLENIPPSKQGKATEEYLEIMRRLDALAHNAREIIDVDVGGPEE